jgi:hypothetical protein
MTKRQRKPWWKTHEEMAFLFEKLWRPFETEVLHDTRQRDIVGILRQLDVGIIDASSGERKVKAFVEVQKRQNVVGIEDFGNWIYKRDTLQARELVVVSEKGFSKSVVSHVKKLFPDSVRLGTLHEVETGLIAEIDSTFLGITRVLEKWWFASLFVQYDDNSEIAIHPLPSNSEEKIFGRASPMDLIRFVEKEQGECASGRMNSFLILAEGILEISRRPLKTVMMTAEKQKKIWEPITKFYAYSEVFPSSSERGIATISTFNVDGNRQGTLILVISPDITNSSGTNAKVAGQIEFF